jgi:3-dehydroquinate synthase
LRALSIKAKITEKDEFEQGERKILNFGHTIGHAIESLSNFQISHGEAVALGMIYETTNTDILEKLIELLQLYKLPTEYPNFNIENIINFIKADKKRTGDLLTIPVVEQIGSSSLETLSISKWKERWQ